MGLETVDCKPELCQECHNAKPETSVTIWNMPPSEGDEFETVWLCGRCYSQPYGQVLDATQYQQLALRWRDV